MTCPTLSTPLKVALLIYPGADILDFSGPCEIYQASPFPTSPNAATTPPTKHFTVTSFAQHNPVPAESSSLVYVPNKTLTDVDAHLDSYDILLVPGAPPETLTKLLREPEGQEIVALVNAFAALPPRNNGAGKEIPRVLQSVCTGAFFLAAAGLCANRRVTKHHLGYEALEKIADEAVGGFSAAAGASGIMVQRKKRWVDAGMTQAGVRIVTAGGVSSGIDASLWLVERLVGREQADWAAEMAEFERRGEEKGWGA